MTDFPLRPRLPLVRELRTRFAEDGYFSDHPPSAATICRVLNIAFWASMQSEEGQPVRATIAITDPDYSRPNDIFRFSDKMPLSSRNIAKLSASFPFQEGAVAVTIPHRGRALIWGIVLPKPRHEWLVEILGPGYIVIRNGLSIQAALLPDGSLKLFNELTRLEDEWCDFLFHLTGNTAIGHMIPLERRFEFYGFLQVLSQAMVEHHRGGSVVIVSPDDRAWETDVDFTYKFDTPERYLSDQFLKLKKWQDGWSKNQDQKQKSGREKCSTNKFYPDSKPMRILREALKLVGGITAVDGAVVMTTALDILGYGAKLKPKPMKISIRELYPFQGYFAESKILKDIGGTRHGSAAQFVIQHPGTIVFVASQDGRFTIFYADESATEVMSLRVELLLL